MFKVVPARIGREKRHRRIRQKIQGTAARPRLCVFRSLIHIYAQIVDDEAGRTLVAVSTLSPSVREQTDTAQKSAQAAMVGRLLAQKAQEQDIRQVVFDRGGYRYHGRVKALADAAREGGLAF
jgi:large subunit ribosomal protein L18